MAFVSPASFSTLYQLVVPHKPAQNECGLPVRKPAKFRHVLALDSAMRLDKLQNGRLLSDRIKAVNTDIRLRLANGAIKSGRQVVNPATTLASCLHQPLLNQALQNRAGVILGTLDIRRSLFGSQPPLMEQTVKDNHLLYRHWPLLALPLEDKPGKIHGLHPAAQSQAHTGTIGTGIVRWRTPIAKLTQVDFIHAAPGLLHQPNTLGCLVQTRIPGQGLVHQKIGRSHPPLENRRGC